MDKNTDLFSRLAVAKASSLHGYQFPDYGRAGEDSAGEDRESLRVLND